MQNYGQILSKISENRNAVNRLSRNCVKCVDFDERFIQRYDAVLGKYWFAANILYKLNSKLQITATQGIVFHYRKE